MKILVFSQFFPPEITAASLRVFEHASHWVRAGHRVTVITNVPNYPFGHIYDGYSNRLIQTEVIDQIEACRMWTYVAGTNDSKLRRACAALLYLLMATIGGLKGPRPDVIIASAPYFAGIPGLISALLHRVPLVYEMRDPWVQVAAEKGTVVRNKPVYYMLARMEKAIAHKSSKIVVIGQEMARFLEKEMSLRKSPEVVPNAVDPSIFGRNHRKPKPVRLPEAENRFVVGLIGSMGIQYDFRVVLDAAESLASEACFFLFLGEGIQKNFIRREAELRRLENVRFYPAVSRTEVSSWVSRCDVTVVSLAAQKVFRVYLPLKMLESQFLGVPVLFGGRGEGEHLVRSSGGGAVFSPGDAAELVGLLRERMHDRTLLQKEADLGSRYISTHFTRNATARRYLQILQDVINGK